MQWNMVWDIFFGDFLFHNVRNKSVNLFIKIGTLTLSVCISKNMCKVPKSGSGVSSLKYTLGDLNV